LHRVSHLLHHGPAAEDGRAVRGRVPHAADRLPQDLARVVRGEPVELLLGPGGVLERHREAEVAPAGVDLLDPGVPGRRH
ncbi:hypothetical protein DKP78_25095, partial [Enterococcus faecium]